MLKAEDPVSWEAAAVCAGVEVVSVTVARAGDVAAWRAGGVGVQQQRGQVEDDGVVEGDEPGGLAGAAVEHADDDHERVPDVFCGCGQGVVAGVLVHVCLIS
ncbi:hypothetical protein ABT076_06630 [Streptomyces sp. NPDC002131]|uniref:hypothetical protein n=1 Tax=Streptomyces sp. NPDC002131 TaxID=3154535 RepID=UPI003328F6AF